MTEEEVVVGDESLHWYLCPYSRLALEAGEVDL